MEALVTAYLTVYFSLCCLKIETKMENFGKIAKCLLCDRRTFLDHEYLHFYPLPHLLKITIDIAAVHALNNLKSSLNQNLRA